jgi:catechol 2,3-dioxygenase-like lactoylglutathione lyase family enzyme
VTILEFKEVAEGIQAIVLSLAALAAGTWAVLAFAAQRYGFLLKRQPLIRLSLDVEQASLPGDPRIYLSIRVTARNAGNVTTSLKYSEDDHLTVTPITITEDGNRVLGKEISRILWRRDGTKVDSDVLLPSAKIELPFWVPVPGPGLYLVRFYVKPTEDQRLAIMEVGHLNKTDSIVISANRYYVVRSPAGFSTMRGHHAALRVPDFEASKRWFVEKLDFRVLHEWSSEDLQLAYLAPANDDHFHIEIIGGGSPRPKHEYTDLSDSLRDSGYHHFCLEVASVDDTLAELRRRGVTTVGEPFDVPDISRRLAFFADPWGNLVELAQVLS